MYLHFTHQNTEPTKQNAKYKIGNTWSKRTKKKGSIKDGLQPLLKLISVEFEIL